MTLRVYGLWFRALTVKSLGFRVNPKLRLQSLNPNPEFSTLKANLTLHHAYEPGAGGTLFGQPRHRI